MLQAARSQVRFPMKSLDFSIELILPTAPWPWGHLSLKQIITRNLPGDKRQSVRKADNLTAISEQKCGLPDMDNNK
jgi:hypothetical protein